MYKPLLIGCLALFLCAGCAIGKQTVSTVLTAAYEAGGASLVGDKIDQLVKDGKLTEQQAKLLKDAAKKSYEQLQNKLTETKAAEIEVTE